MKNLIFVILFAFIFALYPTSSRAESLPYAQVIMPGNVHEGELFEALIILTNPTSQNLEMKTFFGINQNTIMIGTLPTLVPSTGTGIDACFCSWSGTIPANSSATLKLIAFAGTKGTHELFWYTWQVGTTNGLVKPLSITIVPNITIKRFFLPLIIK